MTATPAPATTATILPAYRASQRVTQLRVIRSEFTKLRSLPSTGWSLLIAITVIAGFGILYCTLRAARPPHGAAIATFDPTAVSLAGVEIAMLVAGVLGGLFITGEHASGQLRATFAAVPARLPVLWAKAAVLAAAVFAACLVATTAAFVIGQSILASHHLGASLGDPGTIRAVAGSAAFLAAAALLGLGLGTLLRNTAGATGALFGVLFALQLIASFLPASISGQVTRYLPGPAGLAITTTAPDPATLLAPWAGLGLFCAYTAIVLGLAAWRMRRQEA
jgi:ABC-2 type transport system permease protein